MIRHGHPASADSSDDAGITLIEILVYSVISAVVVGLIASLFATSLDSQADTRNRDTATGRAHVVSESIQSSIRNATGFTITGPVLRARVATGASSFECRAWALTASGEIVYRASSATIATGSYAGWTRLASGVTGTLSGGMPFAGVGAELQLGLAVVVGDARVPLTGAVSAQAKSETAGVACW